MAMVAAALPVVINMAHEAKPHLPSVAITLWAVVFAVDCVVDKSVRKGLLAGALRGSGRGHGPFRIHRPIDPAGYVSARQRLAPAAIQAAADRNRDWLWVPTS